MDFGHAALLIAAAFGAVELIKALAPAVAISARLTVAVVLATSVAMTFLVATTVWAHEQVIGGHPLDKLGTGDKFVVALFLAGAAAFGDKLLTAVRNIGQNQAQKPIAK